jgi:4-carboxymuconolactone decarboxylase
VSRERGLRSLCAVYSDDVGIEDARDPYEQLTLDHLFGDIWTRPGLSIRERRLLVTGVVAALGREELAELQLFSAMQNGELTPEQVDEVVLHLTHYIGWPLGSVLHSAARRAVERHLSPPPGE